MFQKVLKLTLGFLGITAFAKDDKGKSVLLSEQKKKLTDKWGERFVESFEKDLAEFEKDGATAESALTAELDAEMLAQYQADKKLLGELQAKVKQLEADNEKMAKSPAGGNVPEVSGSGMNQNAYKPDMNLSINKKYFAAASAGYEYNGNSTIDTEELRSEFGRYVSSEKMQIFLTLLNPTNSMQYMSTLITDKFQVKATQAAITSVLQSFTPQWTPKGKSKFTPLVIEQYPMKINVSIYPSDIINDVLGYLYDEKLDPKDMPIVRYIVEQLVRPKLEEDREQAISRGRYEEPAVGEDGKYKAGDTLTVCNGYLTQLCDLYKDGTKPVNWLFKGKALGEGAQLVTDIESAVDEVSPKYKNKHLTIHADPDLILKYSRAYRDKYPNTKNEDGQKVKVDYTNFTFAGLEGMRGSGAFFITPKENFKHIMSRDPKNQELRMATQDYEAKIYGEWREGCGFWIAEAIFAYLPEALVNEISPAAEVTNEEGL